MAYIINVKLRFKHSNNMFSDPVDIGINIDELLFYNLNSNRPYNKLDLMKNSIYPMYKLFIKFNNGNELTLFGTEEEVQQFKKAISSS